MELLKHLNAALKLWLHTLHLWLHENALWLVGLGLMLASSGIDGAYLARLMSLPVLGYVLNTTADIASMTLTYYYGRLLKDNNKGSKKYKLAGALLGSEVVSIGYSWYFSFLQLRIILQPIEPVATGWFAFASAGFIPLLLAFIGFAQALISTPPEVNTTGAKVNTTEQPVNATFRAVNKSEQPVACSEHKVNTTERSLNVNERPVNTTERSLNTSEHSVNTIECSLWRSLVAGMNGDTPHDATGVNQWLSAHGYEQKSLSTARRWALIAQQVQH